MEIYLRGLFMVSYAKNKTISVFLPTRKGSERVRQKNTRPFATFGGGLLELKLQQLIELRDVDEIILSTNDELSFDVGSLFAKKDSRVKVIIRPEALAQSNTNLIDLVRYVPEICSSEHILWTHVTSPFTDASSYLRGIEKYFWAIENCFDSLMSVKKNQSFLWDKEANSLINNQSNLKWPRTQDLKPLYEIDSALFLASKKIYLLERDRIGERPFLYEQDGLSSFDIDWEDDFRLAETIYLHHVKRH